MIMTRHTLIPPVLLALVSFPIFGMDFNNLEYREGLYYDKSTDSPFTGKVRGLSEGLIREGKQEGPWIEFHRKRKLYLKGNYENGKRNGSWTAYWSSGQLVHQAIFKNGVREGNWNDYINDGNVAKMYAATSKRGR